jgi:NADPH-dependent 2,4-dienoyl-CoA reductase/sulfur reductase-like enzyme
VRERFPETSITIVHANSSVLHPTAKQPDLNSGHFNYSSPPTSVKLSKTLEGLLRDLKIELVFNDKVVIPVEPSDDAGAWDGSFGLQSGLKKVKLQSGQELEADFVFVSIGNKPNVSLVENVDKGAITQGLIAVDEYLKVGTPPDMPSRS